MALCLALLLLACESPPTGPPFRPNTPPDGREALVYIHRADALRGVGAVDLNVDGESLGRLRDGEYLAILLEPGSHQLGLRLRWLGWLPRGWNRIHFEASQGETVHVRVWAGLEEISTEGVPDAPGRADSRANVNIFASRWTAAKALPELEICTRAPGR